MKEENYIQAIADKVMAAADIQGMSDVEAEAYRKSLEALIINRLGLMVMDGLGEEGLNEYEKSLTAKGVITSAKLEKIISKHAPDLPAKLEKQFGRFFQELLTEVSY